MSRNDLNRTKSKTTCTWRDENQLLHMNIWSSAGSETWLCAFKCWIKIIAPPKGLYLHVRTGKKKGLTIGSTSKSLLQFNQSEVRISAGWGGVGVRGHTCGGTSCGVQEAGSGRIETAAFTGPWWRPRGWTERRSRCSWRSDRTCWCGRWPSGTRASLWSWTPPVWLQDTWQHSDGHNV